MPNGGKRASVSRDNAHNSYKYSPSAFTLTFVIEVVGIDIWHDCNEGWLELGPPVEGLKLSYQLYPGQNFDVEVVIWPHIAKVCFGTNYCWVRTWQFLQRRWLTFSICHVFPVRVTELCQFEATVTPNFGIQTLSTNSKVVNAAEVYLPPLTFGERRQFAKIIEAESPLKKYIIDMIWSLIVDHIPISVMDGLFDTPYPVQDVRHQDAALYQVQDVILNRGKEEKAEEEKQKEDKIIDIRKSNMSTKNPIRNEIKQPNKYEITLSGDWILAGIGRVTPFVINGDRPTDQGEVIALISSMNLPALDDFPIFFVNVCNLTDIPIQDLEKNRLTHIYTRWTIGEEEHNSEQQSLKTKQPRTEVNFNDHHVIPLGSAEASEVMARFLDVPFRVELRGIRIPLPITMKPKFFGYEKTDRDYGVAVPPPIPNQDVDILIAQTRIDAKALTKINGSIKGEFPLYPPEISVMSLEREAVCTNDVNAVRLKVKPDLFIQPGVILEAQMTIEVSLGIVGCKPKSNAIRYSRLYCLVSNRDAIMTLLRTITEINESLMQTNSREDLLTGFGLDTGDTVVLYVEGPREGEILRVWEKTEDFYPIVKPIFSTSAKYSCRLYPELLLAAMPFNIMKMFVPLSVLLGLTPIYVRPAIPLTTRSAILKIGSLIASKIKTAPCCRAMPTALELKSFKLELCVAPRPPPLIPPVYVSETSRMEPPQEGFWGLRATERCSVQSTSKIYWKQKEDP